MPSKQGPLAKGLGMLRRLAPPPPAPPAPASAVRRPIPFIGTRGLSATDGLRDRPQLRLRAEVVVVVERPDKLPSPRKEVGSSPAVTPAARARTPSEPSAARTRSEPKKKTVPDTKKGATCSGDTRDSGLIPHKTSPHSLLAYDTTLRPWARFPFDSPQAPNCFAARC